MANKKRIATSVAAVATAAALLLGGTFAWQSVNQTALNEASDVINPGGRLHDDFNGSNKDVYVENFAEEPIYARIQLSEYFEIIANHGVEGVESSTTILGNKAESTDGEGNPVVEYTYETFTNYESLDGTTLAAGVAGTYDSNAEEGETGYAWWSWETGGSTVYMPTFNMNKDSLQADINGTYVDAVGGISDRDGDQYENYVEYEDGDSVFGTEIYDADANNVEDGGIKEILDVEHTARYTGDATLISMDEWENDYNSEPGPYWVYDTDGWVYWAQAIQPGTATGLLLDGIELNQVMDDSWYYAINVVAQFVTGDDTGVNDGTGFHDTNDPTLPAISAEAENLLNTIIEANESYDSDDGDEGDDEGESQWIEITRTGEYDDSTWPTEVGLNSTATFVADQENVTWSVDGNASENTTISQEGILTIGTDETAWRVVVYATAIVDGQEYSGDMEVAVKAPSLQVSVTLAGPGAAVKEGSLTNMGLVDMAGETTTTLVVTPEAGAENFVTELHYRIEPNVEGDTSLTVDENGKVAFTNPDGHVEGCDTWTVYAYSAENERVDGSVGVYLVEENAKLTVFCNEEAYALYDMNAGDSWKLKADHQFSPEMDPAKMKYEFVNTNGATIPPESDYIITYSESEGWLLKCISAENYMSSSFAIRGYVEGTAYEGILYGYDFKE